MSSKNVSFTIGEQWLRSAWETARDIEGAYGMHVAVAALPTTQSGVFEIRFFAMPHDQNPEDVRPSHEYVCRYPTSQAKGMEAAFFRGFWQLAQLVYSGEESATAREFKPKG